MNLTIAFRRNSDGILETLLSIELLDSAESDTTAGREGCTLGNEVLVAQPDLDLVLRARLETLEDLADVLSAEAEERLAGSGVGAEVDDELAVDE